MDIPSCLPSLMTSFHSGFCPSYATKTAALFKITSDLHDAAASALFSVLNLLDLLAALGPVNNSVLLDILLSLGFLSTVYSWFSFILWPPPLSFFLASWIHSSFFFFFFLPLPEFTPLSFCYQLVVGLLQGRVVVQEEKTGRKGWNLCASRSWGWEWEERRASGFREHLKWACSLTKAYWLTCGERRHSRGTVGCHVWHRLGSAASVSLGSCWRSQKRLWGSGINFGLAAVSEVGLEGRIIRIWVMLWGRALWQLDSLSDNRWL